MQITSTMLQSQATLGNTGSTAIKTGNALYGTAQAEKETTAGGDTVTISEEGRAKALSVAGGAAGAAPSEKSDSSSKQEEMIKRIKEQIEKLKQEISELQNNNSMPEETKEKMLQMKQSELMQLQSELMQAQNEQAKSEGLSSSGGTRANGFANSLSGA